MRNDHVFYGHIGGRYPTADEIEHHLHAAHRLRAEAVHELLDGVSRRVADGLRRLANAFRRPTAKLEHC
jgi:hypothetical protein